jgi:hypothetical protein
MNFPRKVAQSDNIYPDGKAINRDRTAETLKSLTVTTLTVTGTQTNTGSQVRTGVDKHVRVGAKIGATAGWAVKAATNLPYLGTVPASQTGSTLVIPLTDLKVGDTITAFSIDAQIESAGGIVTLDADLRAVTNVAAEPTDASIGSITQVSVTADTAVDAAKTGLTEVVAFGKTYYLLLTATTAASTDIILLGARVTVTES